MRSWLETRIRGSSLSYSVVDQPHALEDASNAASNIMNDDLEMAEEELSTGSSAFHKLGKGLVSFLRAVLGFEKEQMAEALERLIDAEGTAYEQLRQAQRNPGISRSVIYSPGTEFALCQAQAQLMGAVIAVLTESVTESIKGFYKLRKAYLALDAIILEEKKYFDTLEAPEDRGVVSNSQKMEESSQEPSLKDHSAAPLLSPASSEDAPTSKAKGKSDGYERISNEIGNDDDDDDDDEDEDEDEDDQFFDAEESNLETTKRTNGKIPHSNLADGVNGVDLDESSSKMPPQIRRFSTNVEEGPGKEAFGDNFTDEFIHSSSNMCYGMLLMLLSMLPPAFSTLSKIAGFKGDRKRGIALLWEASKFGNLNGAFAGLVLLGYYNGFIAFCDILPTSGSGAYPKERCVDLLQTFRKRFPKSCLWKLEEARMLANERGLIAAEQMLANTPDSTLKQVQALQCFEKSMYNMFLHRYEPCAEGFQRTTTLNNWSHSLYFFIAACALVERYRDLLPEDPEKANEQAEKVQELLKKSSQLVGKKRIMARQLPFDVFVGRKIQKWEQRAQEHDIDLIDAIGVSPLVEMTYFWNGFKKMQPDQLEISLKKLSWSDTRAKIPWADDSIDEHAIQSVLKAAVLRNLNRTDEAREILEKNILAHDKSEFKGGLKDNWTCPVAHYEMGVSYWVDYCSSNKEEDLMESQSWLEKAAAWETYDLDARVGLRVKTGQETVRKTKEALSAS